MKILASSLTLASLCLFGCGTNDSSPSSASGLAAAQTSAPLTADSLKGTYTGEGDLGTTGACGATITIASHGLFFTKYMDVQIGDNTFSSKVSDVNAALAALGDHDQIELTTNVTTGILSEQDSTLQLFLTAGAVTGLHYQTAAFSGGWIQGPWTVVDCGGLH